MYIHGYTYPPISAAPSILLVYLYMCFLAIPSDNPENYPPWKPCVYEKPPRAYPSIYISLTPTPRLVATTYVSVTCN